GLMSMTGSEVTRLDSEITIKNCGYYEKRVKERGRYSPRTVHIGRQSRPFGGFPAIKNKKIRCLSEKR
ncbi:MAG TPA: hypothetical protein DIC46_00435, partial [Porphyromonadaceae bacterium]|nr:hypothetical protein [Porphyromonadaceae bacterium]